MLHLWGILLLFCNGFITSSLIGTGSVVWDLQVVQSGLCIAAVLLYWTIDNTAVFTAWLYVFLNSSCGPISVIFSCYVSLTLSGVLLALNTAYFCELAGAILYGPCVSTTWSTVNGFRVRAIRRISANRHSGPGIK